MAILRRLYLCFLVVSSSSEVVAVEDIFSFLDSGSFGSDDGGDPVGFESGFSIFSDF